MRFPAINEGPPLTDQDLADYAARHALEFPVALRRQLLDQNGGAPRGGAYVPVNGRDEELLSFFGAGMSDRSSDFAWNADTLAGRLPHGMLAFADDSGGNLFLVDTEPGSERIWFWDHELEGDPAALSLVANSFTEFLDLVRWSE